MRLIEEFIGHNYQAEIKEELSEKKRRLSKAEMIKKEHLAGILWTELKIMIVNKISRLFLEECEKRDRFIKLEAVIIPFLTFKKNNKSNSHYLNFLKAFCTCNEEESFSFIKIIDKVI